MRSNSGRPQSTKSVQWVSDLKKRPQDISSDRKIVKVQVGNTKNEVRVKKRHTNKSLRFTDPLRLTFQNTYRNTTIYFHE